LPEARLATLVAAGAKSPSLGAPSAGKGRNGVALSQELKTERAFLALSIALPDAGDQALREIDPDTLLTSDVYRRAARHLSGRCRAPLSDLPGDDEELARTLADLVERAGRGEDITVDRLHHARLLLELARLDRAIVRARAQGGESVSELAREREQALEAYHHVVTRLERAV